MKRGYFIGFLACFWIFSACGGGGGGDGPVNQDPSAKAKWTYMVYMGADNNLSLAGLYDLNEMESVGSDKNVNIILQAEWSNQYTEGVPTSTHRFRVTNDNNPDNVDLSAGTTIGNVNMADPAELTDFIKWATSTYPAENYALVVWNHGAGWKYDEIEISSSLLKGAVQDATSGSFMSLPDLAKAVRNSGVHLDIINFDACLMAMYEVAYEFRGLVDILVSSEETEPGEGDPYDTILDSLKRNPSMAPNELATVIVDKYDEYYAQNDRGDTTKSAFDMSYIDVLDEKLKDLAISLQSDPSANNLAKEARSLTSHYAYKANHDIHSFCDYLEKKLISGNVKSIAGSIKSIINDSMIANKTNQISESNHGGLAIYLPNDDEANSEDLQEYSQLACNINRASDSGTWGAYVDHLLFGTGGGEVVYGDGGFGVYLYWTDSSGEYCDADLDLYIWEPAADWSTSGKGEWFSPWMGQTSPNGFFSQDSSDSGVSEEYYLSNHPCYAGEYFFIANMWEAGTNCTQAVAHMFIYEPGLDVWLEITDSNYPPFAPIDHPSPELMDLSSPWGSQTLVLLSDLNLYSDWWSPGLYWNADPSAYPGPTSPPTAPSNLVAAANGSDSISLSWVDTSTNEAGFKIYRSTSAGGTYDLVNVTLTDVETFLDSGLDADTQYYYRVSASNVAGESAYDSANATTQSSGGSGPVLSGPDNVTGSVYFQLTWTYKWGSIVTTADGYSLEESSTSATSGFTEIWSSRFQNDHESPKTLGISPKTPGTYYYRVRAWLAQFTKWSDYSNVHQVTVISANSPPAPPSGLSATAKSNSVIYLNWKDNSSNETGFGVYISYNNSSFTYLGSVSANETGVNITGLDPNKTTYYKVTAFNNYGESAYSNTANATTLRSSSSQGSSTGVVSGTKKISSFNDLPSRKKERYPNITPGK